MPNTQYDTPTATDRAPVGAIPSRRLLVLVGSASLALTLLGARALLQPGANPWADPDSAVIRAVFGPQPAIMLLVGVSLLGAVLAGVTLLLGAATRPLLAVVSVVEVLGVGVAFQSISTMALAGYLVAMALPFGLVWIAVQAIRRYRRARWVVIAALAIAGAWGVVTGSFQPAHLVGLAGDLGRGFANHAGPLILAVVLGVAAAGWVLVLARTTRRTPAIRRLADWVLRHRRGLTILAAAGPLPYGLVRASWLTPWPGLVPMDQPLDPEMRLWGLLLGSGAVLGAVLTIGLIRPWGVVFPRWMPWLGGRPVPVRAAVVPGGLVAGITCAAAIPMLQTILAPEFGTLFSEVRTLDRLLAVLVFPFWIWGPALALAVWGYALARRPQPPASFEGFCG